MEKFMDEVIKECVLDIRVILVLSEVVYIWVLVMLMFWI